MKTPLTIQLNPAIWLRVTRRLKGNELGALTKAPCKSANYKRFNNLLTLPPIFFQPESYIPHPILGDRSYLKLEINSSISRYYIIGIILAT